MLKKNITFAGRVARLALGALILGAVWWIYSRYGYLSFGLTLAGLFCIFQAVMGWCVARACGINTKI